MAASGSGKFKNVNMVDPLMYTTVLSQTFSPCGNFLIAGTSFGEVAVFDLQEVLGLLGPPRIQRDDSLRKPVFRFYPGSSSGTLAGSNSFGGSAVNSLASTQDFLLVGLAGHIRAFDWDSVVTMRSPSLAFRIDLPAAKDLLEPADVNSLSFRPECDSLYVGCGDNMVYCFELEGARLARTFQGHEDFIHQVHSTPRQLVSASEDGSARLWDSRQKKAAQVVRPYEDSRLASPLLGKWLGAACISDDWLVCGGGPHAGLWHLRSLTLAQAYDSVMHNGLHVCQLHEDRVLLGGAMQTLTHVSLSGAIMAQVPSSSGCLYSVVLQDKPHKVVSMGGSSARLDLCTNLNYRDQVLTIK